MLTSRRLEAKVSEPFGNLAKVDIDQSKQQIKSAPKGKEQIDSYRCTSGRNCSCTLLKDGRYRANCSNIGLTFIPYFEPDVSEIYLDHNAIKTFPNISVFPNHITVLSLTNNSLTAFDYDPFKGLHGLIELDLSLNKLEYSRAIYKSQIFKDLIHLETLNLQQNNERNHDLYPTEISRIRTLKTLYLDGMDGASFPESYKNLSLLTSLYLGRKGACNMQNIKINTFQNLPTIKHLDISYCKIRYVEKTSLGYLKSMQSLDISDNVALTFRVLPNLTSDLQFTDIKSLKMENIHCLDGVGTIIFVKDFVALSNSSLVDISLRNNRLEVIETDVINILPKTLRYVDISSNRIRSLYLIMLFLNMPSIEIISFNGLESLRSGDDVSDFQHCSDWRGPESSKDPKSDSRIRYQKIKLPFSFDVKISPTLQIVYMNDRDQKIGSIDKSFIFSKPNNLKQLHMSNAGITSITGRFKNLDKVTLLYFPDNGCSYFPEDFFSDFPSLKYLYIQKNFIGHLFSSKNASKYFQKLNRLEHLDISSIGLINFNPNIFQGLLRLNSLNVSRNSLTDWSANIDHMTNLSSLDLSANRIRYFNSGIMGSIDSISQNSSMKIDLSDNLLLCSCDTLSFLKWMNKQQTLFVHFGDYVCLHNTTVVKFKDLADILSSLEKNCASYSEVIAGVVVVILLVSILIVCGILYRYRWKIRYIYQMARKGLKPLNQANKLEFEFDCFLSYAEEDTNFVVREALPVLEDYFGLKVRLHQRDFVPGDSIASNITYNIHKSRKTIAVISSSFLKSYWCLFEFNMARMESIYARGGEPTLLLVLLEDLRPRDLPLMMLDIIHSDSYLKVPDEKNEDFWENFRKAILLK